MKRMYLRLSALLLIAALTGCQAEFSDRTEPDAPAIPTGRYVEEQLRLPAELQAAKKLERAEDGTLYLFGSTGNKWTGPWGLWISRDDGSTWSSQDYPWIQELGDNQVRAVAMARDGTFYVVYVEDYDEGALLAAASTGALEQMEYQLPSNAYGLPPGDVLVTQDGNLLVSDLFSLSHINIETGEVLQEIRDFQGQLRGGELSECNGALYLAGREGIAVFDLATGLEAGKVVSRPMSSYQLAGETGEAQHGHRVVAAHAADGAVYYCDNSGLYRTLPDSPVTELLLGGEQSSLIMPTMAPHQLLVLSDDRYLVLGRNGAEGNVLYRYVYDSTLPSEPSIALRVYSLYNSFSVRQALGAFQRDNPSVKVTYQVALDENFGLTGEDALRALSTEILAGGGPDVLVLDGMPIDSYIRKGALLDLSSEIGPSLQSGDYLDSIVGTYRTDDGLYAVPTRFSVPMLLAPESAENVGDLQGLADWLETQEAPRLKHTLPEPLTEQFYNAEYNALFQADGAFDEGAYITFLQNLERLTRYEGVYHDLAAANGIMPYDEENVTAWAGEIIDAHVGELGSLYVAAMAHQALEDRGGAYHPMGDQYIPSTILGVNAAGGRTQLATAFVGTALSAGVLANDFRDGLPVHLEALERGMQNPNPGQEYAGDMWISWDSYEALILLVWPDDSFFSALVQQLSALRTPVQSSAVIRSLILEQSQLCLRGDKSREDAARDLKQKIDLAAAEQS